MASVFDPLVISVAPEGGQETGGRIHGSVVRTIGASILGRRYLPGETLPREDEMAQQLGVSRTSVREAVKVLSAKGLLEARPRIGVRVRPRAAWHILDPAVLSWHPDVRRDPDLVDGLIEVRRIIEPAAAGLAARRATAADLAPIEAAYLGMERAIPDDLAGCCAADLAFHASIITAGHNIVLNALSGTIEAALRSSFAITNQLMTRQSKALAAHREVLRSIRHSDEPAARAAMEHLLDLAAEDLVAADDGSAR